MSEISFNTSKEDSASSERKATEYEISVTAPQQVESSVVVTEKKEGLIRTAVRGGKLDRYFLMTQPYATEETVDPQQEINDTVDKILTLLDTLKEDFSNLIESESVFSNIMQYHKDLWKLKRYREAFFTDVLVSLESAIKYYDTTDLTLEKINALFKIFGELKEASLQSDFPQIARKELRKVGFDLIRPALGIPEKFAEILKKLKSNE